MMFAGSVQSSVCHLVNGNGRSTVCGLRVSSHISEARLAGRLHLLKARPLDCRVCKHCTRIVNQSETAARAELDKPFSQML
jgi:hypothetical protein